MQVYIVGAGAGDPELITVKGQKLLQKADVIIYAGSLVNPALLDFAKEGAEIHDSASMTLPEVIETIEKAVAKDLMVVRLHTGDPSIYGAIQEQMDALKKKGIDFGVVPGVSSFLATAAALKQEYTLPGISQTVIITRNEGRTPVPEREKLRSLAAHQATMCIFLSAGIVDDVQRQLLEHYPEDTPVAACYHLTWPDQRIYRGVLRDLAQIVHENKLTLTTMIVVGEAMLSMQGEKAKRAIMSEAARILRPGGRYVIHELAMRPDSIAEEPATEIRRALARAINVNARPLTVADWRRALEEVGLVVEETRTAPMALLKPGRMIADEGVRGALRIMRNVVRDKDLRERVTTMARTFKKYDRHLCGVAIVARKPKENE